MMASSLQHLCSSMVSCTSAVLLMFSEHLPTISTFSKTWLPYLG